MDSIGYLGIFVALLGLGLGLWGYFGNKREQALREAAERWREAPGTIITSEVGMRGSSMATSRYAYFVPVLAYTYVVNGRERQGSRLRFGMVTSRSPSGVRAMLAPYPVGGAVKVRYDPDDPDQSVLEHGRKGATHLISAIAGCILVLLGGAIVVMAILGIFSTDISGHWHVRMEGNGIVYEGDLEAVHGAGPLTMAYSLPEGRKRVREDCTLTRNRNHVLVRCANPQILEGGGTYTADNFNLDYQDGSHLRGSVTSGGEAAGTATFTR